MSIKNQTILIVAAHSDDDAFGCVGSIAKLSKNNQMFAIYFTDGVSSRRNQKSLPKSILERKRDTKKAAKILGIKNFSYCSYPDNKLDSISLLEITQRVEQEISRVKPDIIFTHFENDLNIDHVIINKAVITATRPKPKIKVKKILLFETLSSTEWNFSLKKISFKPNYFIDISKTIEKKIKAVKSYKEELFNWPHPRSVKGVKVLAMFRGQSVGLRLAEGFQLLRQND